MDVILEKLADKGCDVKGALERCVGDKELYISLLDMLFTDENYEILGNGIEKGDVDMAFAAAHALKGIIGNMGVTPMYEVVCNIVEPLRNGDITTIGADFDKLMALRKEMKEIIE